MNGLKRAYIDTETTGVDPKLNAVIEIGCIIEIDSKVIEKIELRCQPMPEDVIEQEALDVNKRTREEIAGFSKPRVTHRNFCSILSKYVDKYNPQDKFLFYGWNCLFDYNFLRQFFLKQGDKYFGSYFFWPPIDVAVLTTEWLGGRRSEIKDFHLNTVADYLEIEHEKAELHAALYDAELTRKVYWDILGGEL